MNNVLYISNYNVAHADGIVNKIERQFSQLQTEFGEGSILVKHSGKLSFNGGRGALPGVFIYLYAAFLVAKYRFSMVYMRNPHGGIDSTLLPIFLLVAKFCRVQVILDVPAYPYDDECQGIVAKYSLFIHKCLRPFFRFFVKGVIYNGPKQDVLWGVAAVRLFNCIQSANISTISLGTTGKIQLIVLASMNQWHGYDRLLASIVNEKLFCEQNIELHMFGEGPELDNLKRQAENNQLNNFVHFYGHVNSVKLNDLIKGPAIGIDSLGRHRAGGNYNDSLKSKEYLARGIPIVKSHQDDSVDNLPYVYTVSGDDKVFSIEDLVSWYKQNNFAGYIDQISELSKSQFDCADHLVTAVRKLMAETR